VLLCIWYRLDSFGCAPVGPLASPCHLQHGTHQTFLVVPVVPERGTFLLLVGFLAFNPASTFATTLGQLGEQSQLEPTFV